MLQETDAKPKPFAMVLGALGAAVIATVVTGSVQQYGSFVALGNATLLSNLVIGAIGMMIILPLINVAIVSFSESYRNSRARRNIFFGWGVAITVLQVFILLSEMSHN